MSRRAVQPLMAASLARTRCASRASTTFGVAAHRAAHLPTTVPHGFLRAARVLRSPEVETISLDDIEIELCAADDPPADPDSSWDPAAAEAPHHTHDHDARGGGAAHAVNQFEEVTAVDPFSKSRVINFLKRQAKAAGHPPQQFDTSQIFETREVVYDDKRAFRCRVKLLLPAPHGTRYEAEGVADTEKDAEVLASMHAERVVAACGLAIYALPSMQKRYADTMREQRCPVPIPTTAALRTTPLATLPPALRMLASDPGSSDGFVAPQASTPEAHADADPSPSHTGAPTATGQSVDPSQPSSEGEAPQSASSPEGSSGRPQEPIAAQADGSNELPAAAGVVASQAAIAAAGATGVLLLDPYEAWYKLRSRGGDVENSDPLCASQFAAGGGAGPTATTAAAAASMYDPTEGGTWQLCNVQSTRFPMSTAAVSLAAVFDIDATERVRGFMRHHGKDMDRCMKISHVAVPGASYRMFLAELRLDMPALLKSSPAVHAPHGAVFAKGKASDKSQAIALAAMHAELVIDHQGLPLFPADEAKQAEHVEAAAACGRWANCPLTGAPRRPPCYAAAACFPLPVKQHVGVMEECLGAGFTRGATAKSPGERIVMLHNELATKGETTFLEVMPEQGILDEARTLIAAWMRAVGCRYPDLYVLTRMGDFCRASIVLPLPTVYGVRGGNAVGRTPQQAMDLAALNAVDVLCAVGLSVCIGDVEKQKALVERRKALGLVVPPEEGTVDLKRYQPGYHVEGAVRPLPRAAEVDKALARSFPQYDVVDEKMDILTKGLEDKALVQTFIKRRNKGQDIAPAVIQTGSSPAVRNIVYLPLTLPNTLGAHRVLGVGAALKKRDADRMCYLHAAAVLRACGVDLDEEKAMDEREAKARRQYAKKQRKALAAAGKPVAPDMTFEWSTPDPEAEVEVNTSAAAPDEATLPVPMMHPLLDALLKREAETLATLQKQKQRKDMFTSYERY